MKVNKKDINMEINKSLSTDLVIMKKFMKSKKITYPLLSKEMNYSTSHVARVFSGGSQATEKFMLDLFKAVRNLLQKDLKEFYETMRGTSWTIYVWEYLQPSLF